jgi:hypothetical protein
MKNILLNSLLVLISFSCTFGLAEVALRTQGRYDADGNFILKNYGTLRPYHLPIADTQTKIENYLTHADQSFLQYDPMLGWSPKPNSHSANGLYDYNSQGLRSAPQEYPLTPATDTLRIALFGDSFTHGSDVPYQESWAYYLQQNLTKQGRKVEVLNFGVDGYGMDQAYLRWQNLGVNFAPQLVIFGLQMENSNRNVNLLRPLYRQSSGIPFSKPRFILQNNQLTLINQPPVPPEQVVSLMQNFSTWSLARNEYFFNPTDYENHVWLNSKLIALTFDVVSTQNEEANDSYQFNQEPTQITLAILQAFHADVTAHGGRFMLVHLPRDRHLTDLVEGRPLPYQTLLDRLAQEHTLIRPEQGQLERLAQISIRDLFITSHYSAKGNQFVAQALTEAILAD